MILDFAGRDIENSSNKYLTIYTNITSAVLRGAIKKGEKLPSIREAATQLKVSRTTIENAYARLCIESIAESRPNKGYFIIGTIKTEQPEESVRVVYTPEIKYDFSSRRIDTDYADTEIWRRLVRQVLRDSQVLTSYGDSQGEFELRKALADYTYKARGVVASPENIVIGAGIGPLLNILCGIMGRKIKIGIEGGFKEAESVFEDYGIETKILKSDASGVTVDSLNSQKINALYLLPSSFTKISVNRVARRRVAIANWLQSDKSRIVIEDDYNGELRYTAKTLPAFQSKISDRCVYIGSFSKLLLPSVRIAYMVLPPELAKVFNLRKRFYNQTCGKTEQLALSEYIKSGALEKHLRKLRRLYYAKSQLLCREIKENIKSVSEISLYETSLTVEIKTKLKQSSEEICQKAETFGLRLMPSENPSAVKLCFAGISENEIPSAVKLLSDVFGKI